MASTALAKKIVTPGVSFGSDELYVGGFQLPEGDYIIKTMDVLNFSGFKEGGNQQPRLGVMVTLVSLTDLEGEEHKQFYSMGSKAILSFAPNPDTGKGLVRIPGGPAQTLPDSTNWNMFRKSLYDSGLPQGVFDNDTTVLEGTWVHIMNVPEPKERASFATNSTGEAAGPETARRNNLVAIVTEIKDDGKPWEGTGGIPEVKAKTAAKAPVKAAAKPNGKAIAAPVEDTADVQTVAVSAISDVIEANPTGLKKLKLKTQVFSIVRKKHGDDMGQNVLDTFFGGSETDEDLGGLLGDLGYTLSGTDVVAA